jgi:DNA-binding Xre family transcriptional regulator
MAQTSLLIHVLKKTLQQRGLTYARVAKGLGISESAVKRMFSLESLSLDRLARICGLMKLEITDLLELTRESDRRATELSEEQETTLVSDPKLMLVAILAISHWTPAGILKHYRFSDADLVGLLTRLDRLGIIDLLPGNRIKVKLARNFAWRKGGPIQRFFEEQVQREFFESSFLGAGELRVMVHGSLSTRSNNLLQQRMRKIAEEFDGLVGEDGQLDHHMREGTTMVVAIRPWELSRFTELRRGAEPGDQGRAVETRRTVIQGYSRPDLRK